MRVPLSIWIAVAVLLGALTAVASTRYPCAAGDHLLYQNGKPTQLCWGLFQ